jgi:hypothetical protein
MKTMSSRKHVLAVGMIIALAVSAWGEEAQTNATLRLAIDLVDGSRLIGTPGIATVPVQTSYAKMDVPLTQIQALKIGDDHETVTLNLRNGDKLTGVISLKPIELKTVFGPASIGIEHIQQLRVTLGGRDRGLILWNKMGSMEEVQNSAVGPKGNIQGAIAYAPGVFGNAAHLRGSAGLVYFDIPYLENKHLGTDPFTIAFWAKSATVNQPEGFIMDSYSQGTMMIRFSQHNASTMQAAIPAACPNMPHRWDTEYHHYAIVFEANGRSTFYVDATVKAKNDNTESIGQAFSPRIVLSGEWNLTDGYDWNGYIDNVKAWNYAKTDFSDRTDE